MRKLLQSRHAPALMECCVLVYCMAWEAMQKFTKEVIDHTDWDMGLDKFIKASPQDPDGGAGQRAISGA